MYKIVPEVDGGYSLHKKTWFRWCRLGYFMSVERAESKLQHILEPVIYYCDKGHHDCPINAEL